MQRLTLDHLHQMIGVEYILLHAQEPILFIIRKQQRQSPTQEAAWAVFQHSVLDEFAFGLCPPYHLAGDVAALELQWWRKRNEDEEAEALSN
ncbi:Mediator of RNA polymerase II transcription subunit 6 [Chelonia mydas]|uniref:Mediator of RNA polymerase II transcription subunit 6 n=1 Tax=Chelonia mydas TaxID=8469 RepID=M7C500_CHEMY|nr:Mediator of RNA polymerase II transcription subunit 6 [Chelonia mydas]